MRTELSRSIKIKYNVLTMGLYEMVSLICNLIVPRLIIVSFGSEYNGIISSVTQFVSVIAVLQAGVSGSTRVALYKALAAKDTEKISSVLEANKRYMRKITFIYSACVALLSVFYYFVANTTVTWFQAFSLILILGSGTFAQYFFGVTYQTLLKADQRNYVYYFIQIIMVICNACITVLLINTGCNVHIVKLGSALIYCATPIVLAEYVKRHYKLIKNSIPDSEALKNKSSVMYHTIADIIYENSAIVALTLFYNISLVSVFSVYYLVCNGLRKGINVLTGSLEGGFGEMWVKKQQNTLKERFTLYEMLIYIIAIIVFSAAISLITPFVMLYTKNINDVSYINIPFSILLMIGTSVYCLKIPYMTLIQACGKYKETQIGIFIELFVGVLSTLVCTKLFGLPGAAIGMTITMTIRWIYMSIYVYKNLIISRYSVFIKKIIWFILMLLFCSIISIVTVHYINVNSWIMFCVTGVVVVIESSLITLIVSRYLYNSMINNLLKTCLNILKIKK